MKYLGLSLDGKWSFKSHFDLLAPKVHGVAAALSRLLHNLGGPGGRVRRLYAATVNAVALYGAPVWADRAMAIRQIRDVLRRVQRRVAIRLVRGYRTVSHAATTVLGGQPPLEFLALAYREVYDAARGLRLRRLVVTAGVRAHLKAHARRGMMERWSRHLCQPGTAGQWVVEAIQPNLSLWVNRAWGGLAFRTTQVLTGHGCFGDYLCRVGRERTAGCHHCDSDRDTAQHTLEVCPAWRGERRALVGVVGGDLTLLSIVAAMLGNKGGWRAVVSFCEAVISQKEKAEWERRPREDGRRAGARGSVPDGEG